MSQHVPSRFGRYEIVEKLPKGGGMADIYLATDPRIGGRSVVIKVLRDSVDTPEIRERFAQEANLLGGMSHVNLVTIFDVGVEENRPFIAMEYIRGETLGELIARRPALPLSRKLRLMEELCLGLDWAHRKGVVHRDIKPANLMVDETGVLKILDFGIARAGSSLVTRAGMVMGTLNYMAPEQMMGEGVDTRADMFAAGAVFYELLSYRRAFPGQMPAIMRRILDVEYEPLASVMPDLDPELVRLVSRCLNKAPADRFRDMSMVRRALNLVRLRIEQDEQERLHRHLDHAQQALAREDVQDALRECDQGLAVDPDFGPLADVRDAAVALRDRRITDMLAGARAELGRGALTGATSIVDAVLSLDPASADAMALREAIATGRHRRAEQQALAIEVASAVTLASEQFSAGALDEARGSIERALRLDPDHADALALKSRIDGAIADRLKAEAEARARAQAQAAAKAAAARARVLFDQGQVAQALRSLEAVSPPHPIAVAALAELREKAEEIEREARAKAEREATLAQAAIAQARQLFRAGQSSEAIRLLDEYRPERPAVTAALAELRAEARQREAAHRQQREDAARRDADQRAREEADARRRREAEAREQEAREQEAQTIRVEQRTRPFTVEELTGPPTPTADPGSEERTLLLTRDTLLGSDEPVVPPSPSPARPRWHVAAAAVLALTVVAVSVVWVWSANDGAADTDVDADGVVDTLDQCAATPPGAVVNDVGCEAVPPTEPDQDGDGVVDRQDACADTAVGAPVDTSGCAVPAGSSDTDADAGGRADADNDGVADAADRCASTAPDTTVDDTGCPLPPAVLDADADGVADERDTCADTPAGTRVNSAGCPLPPSPPDADGDRVPDADDRCPTSSGTVDATGCAPPPRNPARLAVWTSPQDQRRMIWLTPGEYQMGSDPSDTPRGANELDRTSATIGAGFWLDELEVTNASFAAFVRDVPQWGKVASPPAQRHDQYLRHWTGPASFPQSLAAQPVTYVGQDAARAYCRWAGKRLPTEVEWEYAARASMLTPYWWGGDMQAERANMGPSLVDVGGDGRRNQWGFYDILGNAMEWTEEGWLRGGSFNRRPVSLRLANRLRPSSLTFANVDIGFRCAR